MRASLVMVATLAAAPAPAAADAYETSVHIEATGGLASVGDPIAGGDEQRLAMAGGAARFTWATRDWLAWQIAGYGAATSEADHRGVELAGGTRDFSRMSSAAGLEAGATLRLGVRVIPTASVAVGPQLRLFPETPLLDQGGIAVGDAGSELVFDVAVRGSVGLDLRLGPRWIAGARLGARQALGLGAGSWRSFEGTVHLAYYWYPRWFSLPRNAP